MKPTKPRKPRKCELRSCRADFVPWSSTQTVCSMACTIKLAEQKQAKRLERARRIEAANDRIRREKLKPRRKWLAEAKTAVQASRRLEELAKGSPCMSCQRTQAEVERTDGWKPGGAWDGGHFMGKGACPELALEPLNIWLQCKSCNAGGGKYARKGYTVAQAFEANLRATQGDALVDWLKGPHEPKHYTIPELRAIRDEHRAKARAFKSRPARGSTDQLEMEEAA